MVGARLELSREQILGHRRRAGALDERLPFGAESLRQAAWAGLPDSMPRAALLSIHARVAGAGAAAWEDPSLVQLWGPRYSVYVIAREDLPVFSLGRLPEQGRGRRVAEEMAERLDAFLAGRRMRYDDAGIAMGIHPNALRYGAQAGRVLLRWEGARRPLVWTVPRPAVEPRPARLELARRYLHVLGPAAPEGFRRWAGMGTPEARSAFEALTPTLLAVTTPIGDGWILAEDEASFRSSPTAPSAARLLPSGDTYVLLHGPDREIVVPNPEHRARLWTPRVWPGALLVDGQVVGTWRRDQARVTLEAWRRLTPTERQAVEAEVASLPLPGLQKPPTAEWILAGDVMSSDLDLH